MNVNDLTIGQAKELASMFNNNQSESKIDNKMLGKYVIVRCKDAGVHTGYLESYNGREAVLTESRRLWYWKPANNQKYLSGIAVAGLHEDSKVGAKLDRIHLTETCEIIQCNNNIVDSILGAKVDESK